MTEARELGSLQIGFSGGEPLVRQDLEVLVREAKRLGFYTNLITSAVGMDKNRLLQLKEAGLDHLQVSFQGAEKEVNDFYAANKSFEHKILMAQEVKKSGIPMVLNFVLHRNNIHQVQDMLELSLAMEADYVELANCQYYGWALLNREQLMPSLEQLQEAERTTNEFRKQHPDKMQIFFVVPDYYEKRPKACCNGWGTTFLTITPDGTALPCQGAKVLPNFEFPTVKQNTLKWIWEESQLFNHYRGDDWMQEPCRSCPDKNKDFGGCRCQAYLLTGDPNATDPVCELSPQHNIVTEITHASPQNSKPELIFRNPGNYKNLIATDGSPN